MRFLVDAQLPAKLATLLNVSGQDAIHSAQLPEGNRTTDAALAEFADSEERVVITKDRDFRDSHFLRRSPRRLLVVSTGNVTNKALLALFNDHLGTIVEALGLGEATFVEIGSAGLVIHNG